MTDDSGMKLVSGLVKWFDPAKGYGFILNSEGGADILLHANVLRNFGRSSVADQSRVTVKVQDTQRGVQAAEVMSIEPPETDGQPPIADLDAEVIEHLDSLPLRPARVKWFDKAKGFGFANIFGHPEDVFIHIEVLRHSGFSDLVIGEAICVRVVEGPRGLMAAQITAWDLALHDRTDEAGDKPDATDDGSFLAHVAE
ncbi:cold shock domain-containing protein [Paracoccus sp. 1_MG-2023]|uniref:cold-shock protein n=1 Tax=unclassified Paracoccus (in: a-proteobacteria) TaxID=2688777 RepID=UPI001C0A0F66|nr:MULTISPECIES: cold shock domain-containing protein [unclassified Paracoccus (in: a-proteobacteria)]MBU2958713.1 cold shock domain-containing protein [Paracoccus sp. C2R09]MDO6667706.1 cold shock domain-containing protein [Paracoccus sp. 1_MG-2023]